MRFECPNCKRGLKSKPSLAGKLISCPACGYKLKVPRATTDKKNETPSDIIKSNKLGTSKDSASNTQSTKGESAEYFEVVEKSGNTLRFSNVGEIRDALLAGRLTRHDLARHIYPEPELSRFEYIMDDDRRKQAFDKAREQWQIQNTWRPIGCGLATEDDRIKVLYNPLTVYLTTGGMNVATGCSLVAILACLVYSTIWAWGWDISMAGSGRPVTPRSAGTGGLLRMLETLPIVPQVIRTVFGGIAAILVGILIGFATGYPMGAAVGGFMYSLRKNSLPRPPADGFDESTCVVKNSLTNQCVASLESHVPK